MRNYMLSGGTRQLLWTVLVGLIVANLHMAAPAYPAGRLILQPMNFDCGVVDEGLPAAMHVQIENVGSDPALIKNVQTN